MNVRAVFAAAALSILASASAHARATPARFGVPEGMEFPNGVAVMADGSVLAGGGGGGTIWRMAINGRWRPFFPGAPDVASISSLRLDAERGVLWGAAPDIRGAFSPGADSSAPRAHRVFAMDPVARVLRFVATVPDHGFGNDIALDGDGGAYLTDSLRGRVWRVSAEGQFMLAAEDPRFRNGPLGPSGIARLPDGDLVIGLFSAGELYRISDPGSQARIERIPVERRLSRPDGLAVLPDGRLLVIEGGRGELQSLDLATGRLRTIAAGLAGPVNLAVRDGTVWLTESGVNDPAAFDPDNPPRERYALRRLPLAAAPAVADELPLPSGFSYPNGIAHASDGTLFVGLITRGSVLRRSPEGRWSVFFAGSDAVYAGTSLRLDEARGLLWGASPDFLPGERARPDRIFALAQRTGALRQVLALPDGGFGNDLAIAPDGTLYVTDSRNGRVLRLRAGTARFETVLEHPGFRPVDGVGVGGIALAGGDRMVVGNFGSGALFAVEAFDSEAPRIFTLVLPRRLENPDGLAMAPGGALLVIEGAADSGDGKLLRIPDPFGPGRRRIETLLSGLESPVNLSVGPAGEVWITESRIRHRMRPRLGLPAPDSFRVLRYDGLHEAAP